MNVDITDDDIRVKLNLTAYKTSMFTKKSFLYKILGFTQSLSGEAGDFDGFVHIIPGTYKSDRPINITGIDKVHLKSDCIQESIVNGTCESIFYAFVLS